MGGREEEREKRRVRGRRDMGGKGGKGERRSRGKKIGKKIETKTTLSIVTSTLRGEHTVNLLERHQSGQFCNVVW